MQNGGKIVDGIPLLLSGTSSTNAGMGAGKRYELIVHALPVDGCVTIVSGTIVVMPKWMKTDSVWCTPMWDTM